MEKKAKCTINANNIIRDQNNKVRNGNGSSWIIPHGFPSYVQLNHGNAGGGQGVNEIAMQQQ